MVNPLGLLAWKIKVAIAGAVILGALWWIQHARTVAFEQGVQSGRVAGAADLRKEMEAAWARERASIQVEKQEVVKGKAETERDRQDLNRVRATFEREAARTFAAIAAKNVEDTRRADQMPAGELVPAIRSTLNELRAIELERAGRRAGPAPQ